MNDLREILIIKKSMLLIFETILKRLTSTGSSERLTQERKALDIIVHGIPLRNSLQRET